MTDKTLSPFDYIRSITDTKVKLDDISGYNKYMINRGLSLYPDLIFDVNIMNLFPNIDEEMHYDFLLNSVRRQKRFGKKWPKPKKSEDIDLIMNFYKFSKDKAEIALSILTSSQIEEIRTKMNTGGVIK